MQLLNQIPRHIPLWSSFWLANDLRCLNSQEYQSKETYSQGVERILHSRPRVWERLSTWRYFGTAAEQEDCVPCEEILLGWVLPSTFSSYRRWVNDQQSTATLDHQGSNRNVVSDPWNVTTFVISRFWKHGSQTAKEHPWNVYKWFLDLANRLHSVFLPIYISEPVLFTLVFLDVDR